MCELIDRNATHKWIKTYICQYGMIEYPGITYRLTGLTVTIRGFYSYARYMNERMIDDSRRYKRFNNIKSVVGRFVIRRNKHGQICPG